MLVGIAIFVGGMIAVYLILKYYTGLKAQTQLITQERVPFFMTQPALPLVNTVQQSPKREVFTRRISVNSQTYLLEDKQLGGLNWTSFDLTNNGPSPVYFSVNNMDWPESPLPVGQTINIDFKQRNAIKKIYLKCDVGNTAEVMFWVVK